MPVYQISTVLSVPVQQLQAKNTDEESSMLNHYAEFTYYESKEQISIFFMKLPCYLLILCLVCGIKDHKHY